MKQGLIVYLVGGAPLLKPLALRRRTGRWATRPTGWNWCPGHAGFFSVEDAWHFLATKEGCGRIDLVVAEPRDRGGLTPLSPAVRLCG